VAALEKKTLNLNMGMLEKEKDHDSIESGLI